MTTLEESPVAPRDHLADWRPSELRRVVVRLIDGDVVQVGTAPSRDSALNLARSVIAEIDAPSGDWPLVGNRLLRPESILAIELVGTGAD